MANKMTVHVWVVSQNFIFTNNVLSMVRRAFPHINLTIEHVVGRDLQTLKQGIAFDLVAFDLYPAGESIERNNEILMRLPVGLRRRVMISDRENLDIYRRFQEFPELYSRIDPLDPRDDIDDSAPVAALRDIIMRNRAR